MRSVRLVFVVDEFPVVSETFVTEQVSACAATPGVEVDVVALRGDMPAPPGVRVHLRRPDPAASWRRALAAGWAIARVAACSPRRGLALARAVVRSRRGSPLGLALWAEPLLRLDPPDYVVCHFGWNARRAARIADALRPAKLAAVLHGADLTSWVDGDGAGVYRQVIEEFDRLLPVSDTFRRRLLSWGADPERTQVNRVGIDVGAFRSLPGADADGPGLVRLLSIARLVEKKGLQVAIRALRSRPDLDVVYDIVGDGPLRAELHRLAEGDDRVRFHGTLEPAKVREALSWADVLLAPSLTAADGDQEGIPVAIMEAMAAGLPVVATRHSGIPELVADGETGLLVDEGDVAGLADALARIVGDTGLRCRLGEAGRVVVGDRHDVQRQRTLLLDVLR